MTLNETIENNDYLINNLNSRNVDGRKIIVKNAPKK